MATVTDLNVYRELREVEDSIARLRGMRAEIDDELEHALGFQATLRANLEGG